MSQNPPISEGGVVPPSSEAAYEVVSEQESLLAAYQETMRQFLQAQENIMMAYLTGAPASSVQRVARPAPVRRAMPVARPVAPMPAAAQAPVAQPAAPAPGAERPWTGRPRALEPWRVAGTKGALVPGRGRLQ